MTTVGKRSYNVNQYQASNTNYALNHSVIQTPPTTAPSFNGMFLFDIKQPNIQIHSMILQLTPGALTGITGGTSPYPHFIPSFLWIQRIELLVNGSIVDTNSGVCNYLKNQLYNDDPKRNLINAGAGPYSNTTTLYNMTATSQSWMIPLKNLFDETHFSILNQNHYVQLRVYMQPLGNIVDTTGCTVTALSCNLSANLISRVTNLDTLTVNNSLMSLMKTPKDMFYHTELYQNLTVQSGVSTFTGNLPSIAGKCDTLMFICRPQTGLTGSASFQFTPIQSFNILSSSGQSVIGGVQIPSLLSESQFNRWWSMSSFTSDPAFAVANSYVYIWSFSSDPNLTLHTGQNLGYMQIVGSEQLNVVFNSTLSAPLQIDVFSFTLADLNQTTIGVSKLLQ